MSSNNIEFYLTMDVPLGEFKDILEKLRLDNDQCSIGGEDGAIQYDYNGYIIILDADDQECKKLIWMILENPYLNEGLGLTINGNFYDVPTLRFAFTEYLKGAE